ncbi:YlxR family protein [Haloglycomyces albus]|uniref:YlxR family protein n=1 Tax=Haloglycomyces albus TaxID=526067 RepID=UPI003CCBFCC4
MEGVDWGVVRNANPTRTCVGCKKRATADRLLRIVADRIGGPGEVPIRLLPDPRRRLNGRGAHVHRNVHCFEQALRRHAFRRALRLSGPIDDGAIRTFFDSE